MIRSAKAVLAVHASCLALIGVASASHAQDAPDPATQVEDIVVTATKGNLTAQDTPIALSVVTGEVLQDRGVVSVADLQNVVPNVSVGRDGFGVNINIRGVTTTDTTSKGDQGIAFVVDGIAIGRPREQGVAFFDVSRVEVLRGPQGTLYGKSTTGGVVNVVTNRPSFVFGSNVDVEIGNYDTRRVSAAVNLPVTDRFALRAAVSSNQRDGWLDLSDGSPARNDQNDLAFRLSGLYDFSETTSLFVTATTGRVEGVGTGGVPLGVFLNASGDARRRGYGNPFGGDINEDFSNVTAEFNTRLGGVGLTYVGGHREYDSNTIGSGTADPAGQTPVPAYTWSQYRGTAATDSHEIRFSNADPGRLTWILGANWYREALTESDHNWSAPVTNPTLAGSLNGIDPVNSTDHESSGVFGQATFAVTERLNLIGGLRYSRDEVNRVGTFAPGPGPWPNASGGVCTAPDDCIGLPNNGAQSDEKLTYRVGADYHLNDDSMIYASVATGYKAGGFNDFDPSTGGTGAYAPESLTAYEAGFKGEVRPGLTWNSSLFYYDYDGTQISSLVNISGNFVIYTRLVPTEIKGWENEIFWRSTDQDRFALTLTLSDSEYKSLQAGLFQNVDWSGLPLDKVADVTASLSYDHDWTLPNGGALTLSLATRYNSGYVVSNFVSAVQIEQDAFTRSDANLTYHDPDDRFTLGAFVRNIEDDLQLLGAPGTYDPANLNAGSVPVSEPRMFGVRLGVKY